jgi:hypothetical protein
VHSCFGGSSGNLELTNKSEITGEKTKDGTAGLQASRKSNNSKIRCTVDMSQPLLIHDAVDVFVARALKVDRQSPEASSIGEAHYRR